MAKTKDNTATTSKKPTHYAYHEREIEGKKGFWTRIGAAWLHGDDQGLNLQLDCFPLDGRITLRVVGEQKE